MDDEQQQGEAKLAALRLAIQHSFPTADINQMLAEIEQGYLSPVVD